MRRTLPIQRSMRDEFFRNLFEKVPEALCLVDQDDTAIMANHAFERLFGYLGAEIAGRSLRESIIPPGREMELSALAEMSREGGSASIETTRRRKDGTLIQVVVSLFDAGPGPAGQPLYFAAYTDIQDLRDTERSLRRAESKYRSIFQHAAEGIFQTSPEGRYLEANPALAAIYGYDSPRDLVDSLADIQRQLYVDPRRRGEFARLVAEHGEVKDFESAVMRKDGSVIWISENARAVPGPGGRVAYYEGTVRDVTARREALEALEASRERYRSLVKSASDGILTLKNGFITSSNLKAGEMYGYPALELDGLSVEAISPEFQPDGRRSADAARERALRALAGEAQNFEWLSRRRDGSVFHSEVALNRFDAHGEVFLTAVVRDVTARKQTQAALERERAHLKMLFEGSPNAMVLLSPDGRILDVNPAFTRMFGHSREEVRGEYNRNIIVPEDLAAESESFNRMVHSGSTVAKETVRKARDGSLVPVSVLGYPIVIGGVVEGVYYIYEDITERKSFEQQLTHQAFHDALTGLPNRTLFMERLSRAMERAKRRSGYSFAVLLLDLDRFKRINDSLGHPAGDALLRGIARRLEGCLRTVDTVARLGGDEFAILLEEITSSREVIQVADRLSAVLARPFTIAGNEVYSGASIGIVLKTQGYENPEDILRDSDIAMYRSKESGKERLAFTSRMHELAVENLRMENELRQGLKNGDLMLHFQPIASVADGRLLGFEALARWRHPVLGLISPARFIPLAEETGLILPLGEWVIAEAMRLQSAWRGSLPGAEALFVTVNISSKQFRQTDLVESIRSGLAWHGIPPALFKLEITESVIMRDAKSSADKLGKLKALGIQLLVDDFGTGYSSLSYLQRFPIDGLKIDRSFISGEGDERENLEIVRTIIALAGNLGLGVVAEGVETGRQLECLRELGCQCAQGYLFSRPVDEKEARRLIGARPPRWCSR